MTISTGYLIDAKARTIRPVSFSSLTEMQALVQGYIEVAYQWPDGDVLYVDEEGMFKQPQHLFRLLERPDQALSGNGLLVGREDDDSGMTAPPSMTIEALAKRVRFI